MRAQAHSCLIADPACLASSNRIGSAAAAAAAAAAQAMDRVHRVGQSRAVRVVKLVVAGTVEERVLALQVPLRVAPHALP